MRAYFVDLIYRALYLPVWFYTTFLHGLRFERRGQLPKSGPLLLVANHQSFLDILCMAVSFPRRIHFLARKSLFRNRLLGSAMAFFENIPIDNAGFSRAGLAGIMEKLNNGAVVLIYPEGERTFDGNVSQLMPGVSLLIRQAKCPIVPIGIAGAFEAWPRFRKWPRIAPPFLPWSPARIAVSIGRVIDGAALAKLERAEMLESLQERIVEVFERAQRLRGRRRV